MSEFSKNWGDSFGRRPARSRGGRSRYEHDRDEDSIIKRAERGARKAEPAEDKKMNNNNNPIDRAAEEIGNAAERAAEAVHSAAANGAHTAEEILTATGKVVDDLAAAAADTARAEEERAERLRRDNDRLEESEARDNAHTGGWVGGLKKAAGYSAIVGIAALGGYYVIKGLTRLTAGEAVADAVDETVKAALLGR